MNNSPYKQLTYGLYLISCSNNEKKTAHISNTAIQVATNPDKMIISCSKNNYSAEIIQQSKCFTASVLKQDITFDFIGKFGFKSGKEINKFNDTQAITGIFGQPIITENCIAYFECRVIQEIDLNSHILFIGDIKNSKSISTDKPLTYDYYRTVIKGKTPPNAPSYISEKAIKKDLNIMEEATQYKCRVCGYTYNPGVGDSSNNIAAGTMFTDLSEDYTCPICGVPKEDFDAI